MQTLPNSLILCIIGLFDSSLTLQTKEDHVFCVSDMAVNEVFVVLLEWYGHFARCLLHFSTEAAVLVFNAISLYLDQNATHATNATEK